MKPSHLFLSLCLLSPSLRSQEIGDEQPATEVEITGEPRLLGGLADGTPPPPPVPPELPDFRIEDSMVRQLPDRKVTVRLVKDPGLPLLSPPPEPMTDEQREAWRQTPEALELLAKAQEWAPETRFAIVSATVYDREKTRLCWWVPGDRERNIAPRSFEAWSNIDFLHLGGFAAFEYDGIEYLLIMAVGATDTETLERWRERAAENGVEIEMPQSPELPGDQPAYVLTKGDPADAEGLALMDGLHALYAKEKDILIAAYESREQARVEREADIKANPPKPKDLILHYWHGKRIQPQQEDSK